MQKGLIMLILERWKCQVVQLFSKPKNLLWADKINPYKETCIKIFQIKCKFFKTNYVSFSLKIYLN